MRTKHLLFAVVLFSFFTGCTKEEVDKCAASKTFDYYKTNVGLFDDFGNQLNTYMDGTNRVFQWGDLVEHVCPHEHVKVDCRVALYSGTAPISARARVDWLFLYEKNISMLRDIPKLEFNGNGEAGLSQAFGEDEAWFIPVIEVYFPTQGSYSADSAFLKQHVLAVDLIATYKAFKP